MPYSVGIKVRRIPRGMAKKQAKKRRAKKRARRKSAVRSIVGPLQPVDIGRTVTVSVKKVSPESMELTLSDGTKLDLKPIILGIERSAEKYNPMGDPIYQVNIGLMISPKVPRKLKFKPR
jgi:hypothetical protein